MRCYACGEDVAPSVCGAMAPHRKPGGGWCDADAAPASNGSAPARFPILVRTPDPDRVALNVWDRLGASVAQGQKWTDTPEGVHLKRFRG